jgi:hypothetical protein
MQALRLLPAPAKLVASVFHGPALGSVSLYTDGLESRQHVGSTTRPANNVASSFQILRAAIANVVYIIA